MSLNLRPSSPAVPIERTGSPMCRGSVHRHCRCGAQVTADDVVVTSEGRYYICGACWSIGRRRWFRPDTKQERIAALERVERGEFAIGEECA